MNTTKILSAEHALNDRDHQDALRIIESAVLVAAVPGMVSAAAREMAITKIRELAAHHPRQAEVLAAIVQHMESYS